MDHFPFLSPVPTPSLCLPQCPMPLFSSITAPIPSFKLTKTHWKDNEMFNSVSPATYPVFSFFSPLLFHIRINMYLWFDTIWHLLVIVGILSPADFWLNRIFTVVEF